MKHYKLFVFPILSLLLIGCGTVLPKPVQTHSVAFSEGVQNAGILGYDRTGLFVNNAWIVQYDKLLLAYGTKLPASNRVQTGDRTGITKINEDRYHVNFEVNDRYFDLKFYEHNSSRYQPNETEQRNIALTDWQMVREQGLLRATVNDGP